MRIQTALLFLVGLLGVALPRNAQAQQVQVPVSQIRYIVTDLDNYEPPLHNWSLHLSGRSFGLVGYRAETSIYYGWGERRVRWRIHAVAGFASTLLLLVIALAFYALRRRHHNAA